MSPIPDPTENKNGVFHFKNAVIRVEGDVYWESAGDFEAMAADCLASPSKELVVDLTQAAFVSSSFIGYLTNFIAAAGRGGKKVRILATTDLSWLFEIMGGQGLFELEIF